MKLQHTAAHCSKLQHTAAHCSKLSHTATHCNTLPHTTTHCNTLQHTATHCNTMHSESVPLDKERHRHAQEVSRVRARARDRVHCNTLQHTATHCDSGLQRVAACCSARDVAHEQQHIAAHFNILQRCTRVGDSERVCVRECVGDSEIACTATHYTALQHTATHCDTLQHTATHFSTARA